MLEGVREWWENISYALEEKGIPPWILPLVLLVVLALGYLFLFPSQQTGSASVRVLSAGGDPISGASVTLEGKGVSKIQKTNANGEAFFEKIPVGNYDAIVSSPDAVFPDAGSFSVSVSSGQVSEKTISSQPSQTRQVSLSVSVDGPEAARIQLYDSDGNVVERLGKTAFFPVSPNSHYTIKASADGFTDETLELNVGESDIPSQKITLLRLGQEKKGKLFVGVFDNVGVEGNPIKNASVSVFDAATNDHLLSLKTGEAGTAEPQQLPLGQEVRIVVEAEGFARQSETTTIAAETEKKFRLLQSTEPQGFFLKVTDSKGDSVDNAMVQLLSEKTVVGEKSTSTDGTAQFDEVEKSKSFSAIAFKTGFLPSFKERVSSGEQIRLENADEENSATITVKVLDSKGQGVGDAFVLLEDDKGKPIGFPARQTSIDGVQAWESVPTKKMVRVTASKDGRIGKSKALVPKRETAIEVTLPRTEGSVLAIVSDQFTLQPVPNAAVNLVAENGETAKCNTNAKGECTAKILEGKTIAKISAGGFEEFESSEFEILPGAQAKQNFHVVSSSAAQAGLYFQGIFDLQGNRVKTLSPFTTYNAKYSLVSGGLGFTFANAHVRVGAQDEPLENLPAVISAYKTVGAVRRGIDYSQSSSFIPSTQGQQPGQNKVLVAENAFLPSNIVIQTGDTINWVSQDDNPHVISADDGSFQSPQLRRGASFVRTFNQEGVFYYSDGLRSATRGSITVITKQKANAQQQSQIKGVKWVDYSIPPFKGTKEISVQIKTVASAGSFALEHRSSFNLPGGVLRKPEDPQADAGKNELLAETQQSGAFEISAQGYCDKTFCVQYWFDNGKQTLEANYPDEFNLHVKIYSETPQQLTLTGDNAIQAKSLSAVRGEESATAQANSVSLALEPQGGIAEATAKFAPRKLASDASIKLKAGTIEKTIRLRVVSKEKLSLTETHSPRELTALEQTKLAFQVKDSVGFPVDGAVVTLDGQQFSETTEGNYEAIVSPDFVGEGNFEIAKEGFEVLKGIVRINAPENIVKIEPQPIQASLSQETATVSLTLQNLLKNQVTVSSAIVEPLSDPAYTAFEISADDKKTTPPVFKPGESKDFTLNAKLKDGVLPFAEIPARLRESVKGHVVFVFTVGGFSQEQRVPLQIQTDFQQKTLDELWRIETPSIEFSLSSSTPSAEKKIRVSSQSTVPLLVGFDLKESGLTVSPPSAVVQPNDFADFTLKKTLSPEIASDCFSQAFSAEQKLPVVVSFQGLASRKELSIKNALSQEQNCKPDNAVEASLPFSTDLMLLGRSIQTRENPDGSIALRAAGEVLALDSGASLSQEKDRITVPTGTKFFLSPNRVQKQANLFRISFPIDARMELPSNAQVQNNAQGFSILMPRSIASFPAAVILGTEGGRSVAVIPKGTTVEFISLVEDSKGPNNPGGGQQYVDPRLINPMPFSPLELNLPVEFTMRFPVGSMVIDPQKTQQQASNIPGFWNYYSQYYPQNVRGIFLPPQTRFAFSAEARISQATGGLVEVLVPRQSAFFVPAGVAVIDEDTIEVAFPVPVEMRFPSNAVFIEEDPKTKRRNVVKVADDVSVQFALKPQLKSSGGAQAVLVPPFSKIVFLKGATASGIYDPKDFSECDFVFKTEGDVIVDLGTAGAKVLESGNSKIALLPQFTRVTVKTREGEKEIVKTPKVKRIEASDMQYSGNSLFIPDKTTVTFKVINPEKVDEESKRASITFTKDSAISLPGSKIGEAKRGEINFDGKYKDVLVVDEGDRYNIGQTDKLSISPRDKLNVPDKPDADGRILVGIPAQSTISFIPACKETSGDVLVRGTIPMKITEEQGGKKIDSITVTLNNSLLEGQSGKNSLNLNKYVYVSNSGSTEYDVNAIHADGDVQKAFRKAGFTKATGGVQHSTVQAFKQSEEDVLLQFYIPEEAIGPTKSGLGFGSCIKEDMKGSYEYNGNIVFDLQQKGEKDQKALKVKVVLDYKTVPCTAAQIEKQLENSNVIVDGTGSMSPSKGKEGESGFDLQGDKLFSFKNVGHIRYYAYSNNLAEQLQVSFPDDGKQISCYDYDNVRGQSVAGGKTLGIGESIFLECEAKKAEGENTYKIVAKGLKTGEEKTKTLNLQIFTPPAGKEKVYSSSPIGTLWVSGLEQEKNKDEQQPTAGSKKPDNKCPDPAFKYAYCQNNFCTYQSAVNAICNFMIASAGAFDAETNSAASLKVIIKETGGDKKWKMSFVLHLANSKLSAQLADDMQNLAKQASESDHGQKFQEMKISPQAKIDFTGCGAYLVEADLNPVSAGSFGFDPTKLEGGKKPLQIEFRTQKLMSCPETVANAPILMPVDDVFVYSGNEIIPGGYEIGGLPAIARLPNKIGTYSEFRDENDMKRGLNLANSMYSQSLNEPPNNLASFLESRSDGSKPFFDDGTICQENARKGYSYLGKWFYVTTGTSGALAIVGIFFPNPVSSVATRVALSLIRAQAEWLVINPIIHSKAQNDCIAEDATIHLKEGLYLDAVISGIALGPASGLRQMVAEQLLGTATSVGAQYFIGGYRSESAIPPYGGSKVGEGKGTAKQQSTTGKFLASSFVISPITGALTAGEARQVDLLLSGAERNTNNFLEQAGRGNTQRAARELLNLRSTIDNLAEPLSSGEIQMTDAQLQRLAAIRGSIDANAPAIRAALPEVAGELDDAVSGLREVASRASVVEVQAGTRVGARELFKRLIGRGTPSTTTPAAPGRVRQFLSNARTQSILKSTVTRSIVSSLIAAGIISQMDVQSAPVEAPLSDRYTNYIYSFHYDGDGIPSMRAYCYYPVEGETQPSNKCVKENRIDLQSKDGEANNLCENSDLCIYLTKIKQVSAAVQQGLRIKSYGLFLIKRGQADAEYSKLFASIFNPDIEPLDADALKGMQIDVSVPETVGKPFVYLGVEYSGDQAAESDYSDAADSAVSLLKEKIDEGKAGAAKAKEIKDSLVARGLLKEDGTFAPENAKQISEEITSALEQVAKAEQQQEEANG